MGLFSFIKSAGRLVGMGGHDATQDESKAAPAPPAAEQIKAELDRLGLSGSDVKVEVDGDKVRLSGSAPDAETREKMILAAGNVAGIGAVEEAIQTASGDAAPSFYTVVKGDTLSGISKRQYGDANKYMRIFEANKPMLSDPNKIYPGQVLRIPPAA